jgi:glycosyltransferase
VLKLKFSIIITTLNSEKSVAACLSSCIRQRNVDFEIIIQDGMSSDSTITIIKSYNDDRIKLYSEPDLGIYDGFNKALQKCSGDTIGFLHSDDTFPHEYVLEKIENELCNNNLDGVFSNLIFVNNGSTVRRWRSSNFSLKKLKNGWMPPHPTLFLRNYVYDDIGQFSDEFKIAADYEFLLRLFWGQKYKVGHINEYLYHMQIGGESNGSLKKEYKKNIEDYKIIRKFPDLSLKTLIFKKIRKISQLWDFEP